jgi:Phage phiEco32-like COOH.NH2 ligase-type 2
VVEVGFSYGSDPELMVVKDDGTPVSAIKVLKGFGKSNKMPLPYNQFMFYDNVLLEFNIAPSPTFRDFEEHFTAALRGASEILGREGLSLKQQSSATYPLSECEDEEACRFGCDPEYSIYETDKNGIIRQLQPPTLPKGNTFRSAGGHIHIGHPVATFDAGNPPMVIKMMDLFVGNTALIIDPDPTSHARRKIYGGAGTHRLADYGVEYRTLSNFWLARPEVAEIVYRLTRLAVQLAVAKPELALDVASNDVTKKIINTGDKDLAWELFEKTRKFMSEDLQEKVEIAARIAESPAKYPTISLEVAWGIKQLQPQRIR